jgi:fibronectin-binding autotransporter adhesin
MKTPSNCRHFLSLPAIALVLSAALPMFAADRTWTGSAGDAKWKTGGNWSGGVAPIAGDSLFFSGTTTVLNTNDFISGTTFNNFTFNGPGAFQLWGNPVSLNGNLTNNQIVTAETISLPLVLNLTPTVHVVSDGVLNLNGIISGGFGVTKTGGGQLALMATNSFSGPLSVLGGTVSITNDVNLGAVPGSATAGKLVLDGATLLVPNSLVINSNRGIALGPTTGSGLGTFDVLSGATLTYDGIIKNNGTNGGLSKLHFGALTLSGANTYTGPTLIKNGTLTLDFTQPNSPVINIIKSNSSLTLGGENAGQGTVSRTVLFMNPKAGVTNSQAFSATLVDKGAAIVQLNSNNLSAANLSLGAITHNPGGVAFFVPPTLRGGQGNITTTSTNENGILGGWATISDGTVSAQGWAVATNWAAIDANSNVVNYTGFTTYTIGMLKDFMFATNNLLIPSTAIGTLQVDADNATTTNEVNTITIDRTDAGWTFAIGVSNTLRLGKFGGILRRTYGTSTALTFGGASQARLTAGGPVTDTPGEIVLTSYQTDNANNNFSFTSPIIDNGIGAVTVVKSGSGYAALSAANSFSGGTYILGGRLRWNAQGCFSTGPVFIFPGGNTYVNSGTTITNAIFMAGSGTSQEPNIGAIRYGPGVAYFTGPITLIGDAGIGGQGGGSIVGPISGPFKLTLCALSTVNGDTAVANSGNSWTGDTIITARNNAGANSLTSSNNEVIPNGFGKGNVLMQGFSVGTITWNLNGYNETINGLSTIGTAASCTIQNNLTASTSTLTLGDNDQSGSFGGVLRNGNGTLALTKIGGGAETLAGVNTYTGNTIVSNGILALSGAGSIQSSASISVLTNATLDVSGKSGAFTLVSTPVSIDGGTFLVGAAQPAIGTLNISNSALSVVLSLSATNVVVTNLTTGGATNYVNIVGFPAISSYPTQFVILRYTSGTIGGAGNNFGIGSSPSPATAGVISNDTTKSALVLVLTSGPRGLAWTGTNASSPTVWDTSTTTNWLFSAAPSVFNTVDSVLFDDTGTNLVTVQGTVLPSGILVTNNTRDYIFSGSGLINGSLASLTKQGSRTLTLTENDGIAGDSFSGGVTVSGGTLVFAANNSISGGVTVSSGTTVQVGTNGGVGNLPSGAVVLDGNLIFNRGADLSVPNRIGGASTGSILKTNAGRLALSGANTFTGAVVVVGGTVQAGNSSALGATNGGTIISGGGTLDVNGFNLGVEPVTVSGTGVGNNGAIINTGAGQNNALQNVTLAANATFGGSSRWDIRESATGANDATLNGAFTITKTGTNQVSLVGVQAATLGNINVSQGIFGIERGTTLPASSTITVSSGATLELFANTVSLLATTVLNGDGVTPTVIENSGRVTLGNTSTLGGNVVFSGDGNNLIFGASVGGTANVLKSGSGQLTFSGGVNYAGSTVVSNGSLIFDSNKTGGTGITVLTNAVLGGGGFGNSINENVTVNGGGIRPGNLDGPGAERMTINGNLTLNRSSNVFKLNEDVNNGNDRLVVSGNLTLTGTNVFRISVLDHVSFGDIYTLVSYNGSATGVTSNNIVIVPPAFGYVFQLIDPATTPGLIEIQVTVAIGFDFWVGNDLVHPTFWDTTTTNWERNGASAFNSNDYVCFSDQDGRLPNVNSTNINLIGTLTVSGVIFTNGADSYTFTGSGHLSGAGGLILEGGSQGGGSYGAVTIANSGSNDFTGGVLIDANLNLFSPPATLNVGDGTANGNLGSGTITNDGILVFNHGGSYSNELVLNNNIVNGPNSGAFGSIYGITNVGGGVVVLGGASTFVNELDVLNGVLAAGSDASGSGSAFGSTNPAALVIATNGSGSIDVNGHNLGAKQVLVSGAGLNGQGALINNGVQQINAFQSVTLAGDTTFGGGASFVGGTNNFTTEPALAGTNRWDIRGGLATLATLPPGSPYNITKVGGNQVSLVGITNIDPAISNIDIQAGSFAIQTTTTQLGDPNGTITIHSNAALNVFTLTGGPVNKRILMLGSGTYWAASGANTNVGTITLGTNAADACIFQTDASLWIKTNPIVGPGSLVTANGGTLFLASSNGYTGNTILHGGTVVLIGTTFANSPTIDMSPASNAVTTVDVALAGGVLTLNSGQTLLGNGTIRGSLAVNAGATVAPGHPTGILNVTNTVTLAGLTAMELNAGTSASDQINCTNTITYGGALTVTNINGTLAAGQSFRLFRAGGYAGAFSSLTLPTNQLPANAYWTNTLALNGTIAVVSAVIPHPVVTSITLNGLNATINATNGAPGATFLVLSSTNVSLPLSNWTALATNVFDVNGNIVNYTVTNGVSGPQRFYLLQVP